MERVNLPKAKNGSSMWSLKLTEVSVIDVYIPFDMFATEQLIKSLDNDHNLLFLYNVISEGLGCSWLSNLKVFLKQSSKVMTFTKWTNLLFSWLIYKAIFVEWQLRPDLCKTSTRSLLTCCSSLSGWTWFNHFMLSLDG